MPNHDINLQEQFPNNPDISSDINQAVIDQTEIDGFKEDPYSRQLIDDFNSQFTPQAIGPQGAALYPGLNHNINVGSQQGQIIGGQNIYVPGGNIMARDPVLARRKAVDDASRAKAARLKPFDPGAPGQLKDARFQKKFNETWNTQANVLMDEAKEKYGKDFSIVLQDPSSKEGREFVQSMANFEVMQRKFDQFVDLTAEMREGLLNKSKVYSPEVIKKLDDFEGMMGDFEGGDIWKSQDIDKMYKEFEGHRSFEDYIQTGNFLSDISGITSGWGSISDDGAYFTTSSGESIKFETAVNEVVESLMDDSWGNDVRQGYYDKAQMTKSIRARLKDTSKFKKTAQQKTAATRGEETEVIIAGEDGFVTYSDDQPGSFTMPTYDESGKVIAGGKLNYNPIFDAKAVIKGKPRSIYERTPDGKIQKMTGFRGIALSNPQYLGAEGKVNAQKGTVYSEIEEFSVLDNGEFVMKTKTAIPTTQKVKGTGPLDKDQDFDSYTIQEKVITLGAFKDDGSFNGRGTYTELGSSLTADQQSQLDAVKAAGSKRFGKTASLTPKTEPTQGGDLND